MQHGSYLIAGIFLIAGLVLARFAFLLGRRTRSPHDSLVPVAHASAWSGLAALFLLRGSFLLLSGLMPERLGVLSTLVLAGLVATGLTIWGLGTYLAHVWLGAGRRLAVPLAGFAAAVTLLLTGTYGAPQPVGVFRTGWGPGIGFGQPDLAWVSVALAVPVLLFMILASFYVLQVILVDEPSIRWRVRCATTAMPAAIMALGYGLWPWLSALPTWVGTVQVAAAALACLFIALGLQVRIRTQHAMDVMAARAWA